MPHTKNLHTNLHTDVSQQTPPNLPLSGEEKGGLPLIRGIKGVCTKSGFTLVELIVTITIIAILGAIAFTAFNGFQSSARDSSRASDLANLSQALDTSYIKSGSYPNPDNAFTVTYSGGSLWYQGTVGDTLINILSSNGSKLSKKPTDPLTPTREYTYSKSAYGNTYELSSNWEGDRIAYTNLIPQIYAASGNPLITYIKGNYNGMVAKTVTGSTIYVIATPSITTSTGSANTSIDVTTLSGKLLYHGQTNSGGITFTPTLIYSSGSLPTNDTTGQITLLTTNLKTAYSGSVISQNSNISNVLTTTGATNITSLGASIITNYLGGSASAPPPPPATSYSLSNSLMFDSAGSQYLSKTLGVNGRTGKLLTMSFWAKRGKLGAEQYIFGVDSGVAWYSTFLEFTASDQLRLYTNYGLSTTRYGWYTTRVFRDPSAWIHFSIAIDTSQSGQASRRLWINGIEETVFTAEVNGYNTASMNTYLLGNYSHFLGSTTNGFDGYLADVNFVDSGALDASAFGYTDPTTNQWLPKAYTGSYGTNGFHLDFSSGASLGADSAPIDTSHTGANNWTVNGGMTAVNNQVIDTPLNNFAVLNPLQKESTNYTTTTLSSGNLKATASANDSLSQATIFIPSSGKYYFESTWLAAPSASTHYINVGSGAGTNYRMNGQIYNNAGSTLVGTYGSIAVNTDVIGCAVNVDANQVSWYKNGVLQVTVSESVANTNIRTYLATTSSIITTNFGQGGQTGLTNYPSAGGYFKFQPPSGFKALSTANLPDPTIKNPKLFFDVLTYTGTSAVQSIGGLSFSPDFVWIKNRTGSANGHKLFDTVRGSDNQLASDAITGENATAGQMTGFGATGFSLTAGGSANATGQTYVAWNWKKGTTPGFDIVAYTGNGGTKTVNHSLNAVPSMMIVKNRNSSFSTNWGVYHKNMNATPQSYYMYLNSTNSGNISTDMWANTPPTTLTFTVGNTTNLNELNKDIIAYLWSEVPGFSKFGGYVGNGSTDGPFVYTGFRPRYIMWKRSNSTGSWRIMDTARAGYNSSNYSLFTEGSNIEDTSLMVDILSNGFKIRNGGAGDNGSGDTHIYAAFAEAPFKYANAR